MNSKKRIEKDTLGEVEVDEERLWGAQTQRALQNFSHGGSFCDKIPNELLCALALVKKSAAVVNGKLGNISQETANAISSAVDEILAGSLLETEFPLSCWQSGSGTQTNMNMNEVLANRASEILGNQRGMSRKVHPNDDVNKCQSTNDVFPTAIHLAVSIAISKHVIPALDELRSQILLKSQTFSNIVKIGRTHLQDATPITLGQELSGHAEQLQRSKIGLENALKSLCELAIGGTAVGTGVNSHPKFGELVAKELTQFTGLTFISAPNKFAALAGQEPASLASGALKTLAITLIKIANDLRWLSSGPRCGLGEISLPENEPGSSIMPGKVNPTQCESVVMISAQVIGNDTAVAIGASMGNFELNVNMPLIARNVLHSCNLLSDAMEHFSKNCVCGITVNERRVSELLDKSLMLVTALSPHIGYDKAAKIARKAHLEGLTLREAALSLEFVTAEQFDQWVQPSKMI